MDDRCHVQPIDKSPSIEERRERAMAVLAVDGMGCPNCVQRVRNGLLQVYGVLTADVDLDTQRALIVYNPTLVAPSDLEQAVVVTGRQARHDYRAHVLT